MVSITQEKQTGTSAPERRSYTDIPLDVTPPFQKQHNYTCQTP